MIPFWSGGWPDFAGIRLSEVEAVIGRLVADNDRTVAELRSADKSSLHWHEGPGRIQAGLEALHQAFSLVSHLHSVADTDELRSVYNACLLRVTAHYTGLGQDRDVYALYKASANREDISPARRAVIREALRDFRQAGVDLPEESRRRIRNGDKRLSSLQAVFEQNILDATDAWNKHITDESLLAGLPEATQGRARHDAMAGGKAGWLLTLQDPCYQSVIRYAENADLRREAYDAYVVRASERQEPADWDNGPVMSEIVSLRDQRARCLDYDSYADSILCHRMAGTPGDVLDFLRELAEKAMPVASRELDALRKFARNEYGAKNLPVWDIPYYKEKMRRCRYDLSQEELRCYFPVQRVLEGLFHMVERLFAIDVREETVSFSRWHDDVRLFHLHDEDGIRVGSFYLDSYARPGKRGGAWMDDCRNRQLQAGGVVTPVSFLTCNFTPPVADRPALLTHDEVITLFHEFGHVLHQLLTRVDEASVAGINGVPWDAVEFPSQLLENWCWQPGTLALISGHYRTGERLPDTLVERLIASRCFMTGMRIVRQLELALFDMRLHGGSPPSGPGDIQARLDQVRSEVTVVPEPEHNRFQNSFAHIFSGGYAAGYYGYLWSEVLAADAYTRFTEEGLFDRRVGLAFRDNVLARGGVDDPMEQFIRFRGREPDVQSLLLSYNLAG